MYCEDGQEVLDSMLQAYRLAERVYLPVMVVLDAFFLSHTYEPVDIPSEEEVNRFLPPYEPRFQVDTENPCAFGQLVPPGAYMEMRRNIALAMEESLGILNEIQEEFYRIFQRRYNAVEAIYCDDAEIILVTSGTITSTCRIVLQSLRDRGEKVGILKVKLFRPFPVAMIRQATSRARKIAVIDRNFSFGASGIFAQELRAALCNVPGHPPVFGYITGIGGLDATVELLEEIYWKTKNTPFPEQESIWMGI
jgi:pyruvate ferredoxin oxidoreductase alpha subunit